MKTVIRSLWFLCAVFSMLSGIIDCDIQPKRPRKYYRGKNWNNPRNIPRPPMGSKINTSNSDANEEDFKTLQEEGNITLTSTECAGKGCTGSWGAWQSWSDCKIPLPNRPPMCHNTLRLRKRFCAQSKICHETHWDYCVDVSSCVGQWTQWSEYNGNCDTECTKEISRNRTCLDQDGVEAAGLCLGSKTEQNQYDAVKCSDTPCGVPFEVMLGLIVGGGLLVLLFVVLMTVILCAKRVSKSHRREEPSLVTSQSFLLSQWRIISQRFTRRARSEPVTQERQEIAIRNNYSAVHVYENPNDYSEVLDSRAEDNVYETSSPTYEEPRPSCSSGPNVKTRTSTVMSEERYEYIDINGPYTSMESLSSFTNASTRRDNFKRAHSVDDALMAQRNIKRTQPLPGIADGKIPLPRGVSQFEMRKNYRLTKKPSNLCKNTRNSRGVASKITKKRNSTKRHYVIQNPRSVRCDTSIEEDKNGYLVPNIPNCVWRRQKNQTFSAGIARSSSPKFQKSVSMPVDVETYVTMNSVKTRGHNRMDSEV